MELTCPNCGTTASSQLWTGQQSRYLDLIRELPTTVAAEIPAYLALFKPATRAMDKRREVRILADLARMVREGAIQYKGAPVRPASPEMWAEAMREMGNRRLDLPMKNHNYLCSIVYALADAADRKREVEKNRAERTGAATARILKERAAHAPMDVEWMRKVRQKNRRPDGHETDGREMPDLSASALPGGEPPAGGD